MTNDADPIPGPAGSANTLSRSKRFVFWALMVLLSSSLVVAGAELLARRHLGRVQQSDALDPGLSRYDRLLGWGLTPNWQGRHRHHDFDVTYSVNRYGLRGGAEDHATTSVRRIAVVGDSFTFGFGVNDHQTFTALLNRRFDGRCLVYNFGVPGYSTDQEYLLIKERVFVFAPHHIFLVVYLFNDLIDNLLAYPFQANRAKPYFTRDGDNLRLHNIPVPPDPKPAAQGPPEWLHAVSGTLQAGRLDRLVSRFKLAQLTGLADRGQGPSESDLNRHLAPAKALFAGIVRQLQDDCRVRGVSLSLVTMPGSAFVNRPASASAHMQDHIRRWILETVAGPQLPVLDLATHLKTAQGLTKARLFYPNEGHLTPSGHQAVARMLADAGLDHACGRQP